MNLTGPAKRLAVRVLPHSLYRLYRKRRVARQVQAHGRRWVSHTYGDRRLDVLIADPLAQAWYDQDCDKRPEFEGLERAGVHLKDALIFDLGAHQAVVALMLAAESGPGGRVIALEAEPHNASVAVENVRRNGAGNVMVVHAAVAERSGTIHFAESLNGHVDADTRLGNVEVPAVTIDELAEEHGTPNLVYLDVEGYEGKALEGAGALLASAQSSFFVEVHASELAGASVSELIAKFGPGYALHAAEEDRSGEAGPFSSLDGAPPAADRFFLLAVPKSYARADD
jgi:FkbM family methyltransferase